MLNRTENDLEIKVYHISTNENDHVNYSTHNNIIKCGLIGVFYLRALRMPMPQYLRDEEKYISKSFRLL